MDVFTNKDNNSMNNSSVDAYFNCLETSSTCFNISINITGSNQTMLNPQSIYLQILNHINVVCYLLICILGLTGNCLVIYVVLMYTKMKTVTNMYILNLALSDVMFLTMLPFTVTTVIVKHWIFGLAMCKIHFALSAVNTFGSAFNLCVMSVDRYLAVCHPIGSIKYRTPRIAFCMCMSVWVLCGLVMLPIIMYTKTMTHHTFIGKFSCVLRWPNNHQEEFVWYSFILGFVIPVFLITILYILIILRLRRVAAAKKSTSRRSHGRVTRLIFTVVAVYVSLWLPYWCFQIYSTVNIITYKSIPRILIINFFTILSLTNSMLNPLLYAFLCENFRQCFLKAFKCFKSFSKARSVCTEKSNCPSTSHTYMRTGLSAAAEERVELTVLEDNSVASPEPVENNMCLQDGQDDRGFMKPHHKTLINQ